ncbi:hypothetical protein [Mucilaginibacter myungsuensis]|uniref:Uncharacterized protein n=1 Tax=Mucilaginibacter myungsuensis TaxID=649104 RepID=A0A929KSS4_9SPHI|nr:hypothetical protein [Mucilaginibacter myungsuensis]MBE9660864.1 hypothetical protein [Mucilaginibacter myungsuensis]MDN3600911.1 hypothetical protein [Mucilaginibacter myungsuensis]
MNEIMSIHSAARPLLKTKKFSNLHIELFEQILMGKTNRDINKAYGYTQRSHAVVDHSRKVMYKLLALEGLCRRDNMDRVTYPRQYCFWWKKVLDTHNEALNRMAIKPEYYEPHN